jgi:subtilisin family serine protease
MRSGSITLRSRALLLLPVLAAVLVACPPAPPKPTGNITLTSGSDTLAQVQSANGIAYQVEAGREVRFQATSSGIGTFKWSISGGTAIGTITQEGVYKAPTTVPTPARLKVRAANPANESEFGELELEIVLPGSVPGISGSVTVSPGLITASVGNLSLSGFSTKAVQTPAVANWNMPHVPGQVLLVHPDGAISTASTPSLRGLKIESVTNTVSRLSVPVGETEQAFAERITRETGARVQPNYIYQPFGVPSPNDQLYGTKQFNLVQIDAPGAWAIRTDAVKVAVLDTGADFNHPDLQGRLEAGKDFCPALGPVGSGEGCVGEDADPSELTADEAGAESGHGTHTAGIIAANSNNVEGIAGITWSGKVLVVKVFGPKRNTAGNLTGEARADSVALSKAIRYAADSGAKVINMSLGVGPVSYGPNFPKTCDYTVNPNYQTQFGDGIVNTAIDYANGQKGVLLVAAAGNYQPCVKDSDKVVAFPASNPFVIPVGAVYANNDIASLSARGSNRLLMAPGPKSNQFNDGIWSLKPFIGAYEFRYGTSEAAPQVSAVAALIRAQDPTLTPDGTSGILYSTARDLPIANPDGRDTTFGFGLLQAGAALGKAQAKGTPPPASRKTTIYVYADQYKGGDVNSGSSYEVGTLASPPPLMGRTEAILDGISGTVNFKITLTRMGVSLKPGKYRISACVNKNSNGGTCDSGDLGLGILNVDYDGTKEVSGINITVKEIP